MAEGIPLTKVLLFISIMNIFSRYNEIIIYVHQVENYLIFRWWKPFSHVTLLFSEQIAGLLDPVILKFSCDQKKWMSEKGRFGIVKFDIYNALPNLWKIACKVNLINKGLQTEAL